MVSDSPALAESASARRLLLLIVPALVVGVASALVLLGISLVAEQFQDVLWETLPEALSIGGYSSLWMIVMLTATGLATGLVIRTVHGHAGPDPATTGLVDPPLPPDVIPGLLVVTVLALAGGVSLGPENPITAANIALTFWLGRRVAPRTPAALWIALASAGTIGALFGTPIAAALILSESLAASGARRAHSGTGSSARSRRAPRGHSPCRCWPTPASACHCRRTPARTGAICSRRS